MRRPTRDAGFSLIELLVAVAILAVISIPLLQGFIGTHRTVVRAGRLQGATRIAQDLLETMHAHPLEEVLSRYGEGVPTEEGIRITVTGETANGIPYDALIDIAMDPEGKDAYLASPMTYDPMQDIVFRVPDASGRVRRKIVLTVTASGDSLGKVTCEQSVDGESTTVEEEGTPSEGTCRNVFLIYKPNYASVASTYDEATTEYADTIEVSNASGYPVRIAIIKDVAEGARAEQNERAYRMRLKTVFEEDAENAVYTNLNYNAASRPDKHGRYSETLIHQTLTEPDVELLPLEGASLGAGSFYPVTVRVYEDGALAENAEAAEAIVTISNRDE